MGKSEQALIAAAVHAVGSPEIIDDETKQGVYGKGFKSRRKRKGSMARISRRKNRRW